MYGLLVCLQLKWQRYIFQVHMFLDNYLENMKAQPSSKVLIISCLQVDFYMMLGWLMDLCRKQRFIVLALARKKSISCWIITVVDLFVHEIHFNTFLEISSSLIYFSLFFRVFLLDQQYIQWGLVSQFWTSSIIYTVICIFICCTSIHVCVLVSLEHGCYVMMYCAILMMHSVLLIV